jgi:hypothetical protein
MPDIVAAGSGVWTVTCSKANMLEGYPLRFNHGERDMENNKHIILKLSLTAMLLIGPAIVRANNIEICKLSDDTSPVTGAFKFTVVGVATNVSVNVNECVNLVDVGAGQFTVIEQLAKGTELIALDASPTGNIVASSLAARSITIIVPAEGKTSVFFRNKALGTGRFTGGGSIFTGAGVRVTHGFELHCDASDVPNSLEINWPDSRFHLSSLTTAQCSVNNGVATIVGTGVGLYNGTTSATISFTFTDAGEPGTSDLASYLITAGANVVLNASNTLTFGNQQYHKN